MYDYGPLDTERALLSHLGLLVPPSLPQSPQGTQGHRHQPCAERLGLPELQRCPAPEGSSLKAKERHLGCMKRNEY